MTALHANRPRMTFRLVAIGCAAFVVLTLLAMFLYAGGSRANSKGTHYDFFDNFFSDLGGTHTPSGRSNRWPHVLFVIAMTAAAASVATFFWAIQHFHRDNAMHRRISRVTALLGLFIGLGFLGIAATPWDVHLPAHRVAVAWTFRLMFLAVLLAAVLLWRERSMPRSFAWVFSFLSVLILGYSILLARGPRMRTPVGRKIQVTGQKVIVYSSIAAIGWQTLAAERLLRREERETVST